MIKERGAVKPALDVIIDRDYAQQMPLAECGGFDAAAREFEALCLVGKEYEVVLEGRTLSNMSYEPFWGRASRGIERDFGSPPLLLLGCPDRRFKSRARNHRYQKCSRSTSI